MLIENDKITCKEILISAKTYASINKAFEYLKPGCFFCYINIYICMCVCIYIYREREKEREREKYYKDTLNNWIKLLLRNQTTIY